MFANECCKAPRIENMDSKDGVVNRVCLRCETHWYGPEGSVRGFTKRAWDSYLAGAFNSEFYENLPIPYEVTDAGKVALGVRE